MPRKQTEADRAAAEFYGQSDAAFAAHIAHICRNDPRLIAVFERTRSAFLEQTTPTRH